MRVRNHPLIIFNPRTLIRRDLGHHSLGLVTTSLIRRRIENRPLEVVTLLDKTRGRESSVGCRNSQIHTHIQPLGKTRGRNHPIVVTPTLDKTRVRESSLSNGNLPTLLDKTRVREPFFNRGYLLFIKQGIGHYPIGVV